MSNVRQIKLVVFIGFLILLFLCVGFLAYKDYHLCMGIPIVSNAFLKDFIENPQLEVPELLFDGTRVSSDKNLTTLYISQSTDAMFHSSQLQGTLTSSNPNTSLYFVKTPAIDDIKNAVANNIPLSLIVTDGVSYRQLNVVVTSLPVVYIEQAQIASFVNEQGREVKTGSFVLLDNPTTSSDSYRILSGTTQWHIRGASSSGAPKKPYKLSLKDTDGSNADYNFLDLGADDDWILNPMNIDDTKVREKFAMDFWNRYISEDSVHNHMSSGEYVELVIDNVYQGLYLLQRRVDQKYLQIDQNNDILFKGVNTWSPNSLEEGYEIIYSPYSHADTYKILDDTLSARNQNEIDIEKYIEIAVFLNYISAPDNCGYKNMFYLLQKENDHFEMCLIPWDTDMSMGVTWIDGFAYDYTFSVNLALYRHEHNSLINQYPQLLEMTASYWQEARKQIYTEENIRQLLDESIASICNSGAFYRDVVIWGYRFGDTQDALLKWCADRLTALDSQYSNER